MQGHRVSLNSRLESNTAEEEKKVTKWSGMVGMLAGCWGSLVLTRWLGAQELGGGGGKVVSDGRDDGVDKVLTRWLGVQELGGAAIDGGMFNENSTVDDRQDPSLSHTMYGSNGLRKSTLPTKSSIYCINL